MYCALILYRDPCLSVASKSLLLFSNDANRRYPAHAGFKMACQRSMQHLFACMHVMHAYVYYS